MFEVFFKIWYLIAILPFLIIIEGSERLGKFLKEKDIYQDWDMWHSLVFVLILAVIILWGSGYPIF